MIVDLTIPPTNSKTCALQQGPVAAFFIALSVLAATAITIVAIGQLTDIDLWLADLYFDPVQRVFPWDKTWFARNFMHGYLKNVIVWFSFLLMIAALIDLVFPFLRQSPVRRLQLRFVALSAWLEPLLVRTLKDSSNLHCPKHIDLYGGSVPLLRLLDAVPSGWPPGHCFPAGHASAGMWLSALAILWLPTHPRKALAVFLGGLSIGLTMGWVQQMRGMHFLTHTLATAWLSTALLFALLALFWRPLNAGRATGARP